MCHFIYVYSFNVYVFHLFSFPAYVCGEQEGLIPEKALQMGETLKTTSSKLDVEEENKLVADKLKKLKAQSVPEEDITATLRNFGMERFLSF